MFATALLFTKGTKLRAATITVTNTADSGNGTLRAALASAAAGDTINFSMPTPANFTLTSGELLIPASVSILGPGANNVAIDGNNTNRVFHIGSNTVVNISGLTITHGNGGIFNDHATLTLSNSTLSGNSSAGLTAGGGIRNNGGRLQVFNSTLSFNSAHFGGGIYNNADVTNASVEIVGSTLCNNSAASGGGIINFANGGSAVLTVLNSTLTGNSGYNGGGIWNAADLAITNSTLSGNLAGGFGGAIANYGGTANVQNSTLSGNSAADSGADVHNPTGFVRLGSTILNEFDGGEAFSLISTNITSFGFNLSSDGGGGFLTNATDQINTDPMLGPLQDNGGPTFTHAPLPCSPAIDKGKNFSASASDQRGFARITDYVIPNASGGDGTDIGAVETTATPFLCNFGIVSNEFGFKVIGLSNQIIIVEASTNLANWTPLSTNTLSTGPLYFNDPASKNLPQRFYRAYLP